jgi:hypothetical protein
MQNTKTLGTSEYVVNGEVVSFTEWLFGDDANQLLSDHVNEFVIAENGQIIHLTCAWVSHRICKSSAWGTRSIALRHLRTDHRYIQNDA